MKKDFSVIIEITDTHVKLIHAKQTSGKPIVTFCEVRALHDFSDAELVNILSGFMRLRSLQTDQLLFIIPRKLAILKFMRLPSQQIPEIKKMVGLQLVNQIPYEVEDVIYDCAVVEKEKEGYTQVLVIVVHKDVWNRYTDVFRKAGMALSRATLSSLGVLGWLNYQDGKDKIYNDQMLAVLNIDLTSSEIVFCENKKLIFSRSFPYGAKDLTSDNLIVLVNQIEQSLKAFQNETRKFLPSRIIILSALTEASVLKDKLEKDLKITVRLMPPFENIFTQKNVSWESLRKEAGVSVISGLGLALTEVKNVVNLAPPEIQEKKKVSLRQIEWVKSTGLVLLILILAMVTPSLDYYRKSKSLTKLEDKITAQELEVNKAKDRINMVHALDNAVQQRIMISDLMVELVRLMSPEVSLRSLYLNAEGVFTIQGYARTSAGVNNFQAAMVKSSVFKQVNLEFQTKRKIFNVDVVDFKMVTQLIKKADESPQRGKK